jgi:hypothetical protein
MSRQALVTCAIFNSGGAGLANVQDVIDDFQANFNTNITPVIDSEVTVLPPFISFGDGTAVPTQAVAAGASVVGGNAGTYMPPNVATIAKKGTGFGGRNHRGRTYFPFINPNTTVSENGTIDPAWNVGVNTRLAAFLAQLVTDGTPMVIANKTYNVPLPPHYVTQVNVGHLVVSYVAEPIIGTQRRRLGR